MSSSEVVLAPLPTAAELNKSVGMPQPPLDSSLSSSTPTPNPPEVTEAAPIISDKQRVEELEKTNKKHEQRIKDLELALAESRKIIRDRETLLTQVQWKPKVTTPSFYIPFLHYIPFFFLTSFIILNHSSHHRRTSTCGRIPKSQTNKSATPLRSASKPSRTNFESWRRW